MAIVTEPLQGTGVQVQLDTVSAEDALIKVGVTVRSLNDYAIVGGGSGHVVTVDGSVIGVEGGISLGSAADTSVGNRLVVHKSGMIFVQTFTDNQATPAVYMRGISGQIINEGVIQATNSLPYNAAGTGLFLVAGAEGISVQNSGIILGGANGVRHYAFSTNSVGSKVTLINTGFISGHYASYEDAENTLDPGEPAPIDIVINRGVMSGFIRLNHGNDVYDGSAGRLIGSSPTVDGGAGDDLLKAGVSHENLFGGTGIDTLDFTTSTAVSVNLSGIYGPHGFAGFARGDTYYGFENVIGSRKGNDSITANDVDNDLRGLGGDDVLVGLGGADRLIGGLGRDVLTGGTEIDHFVFTSILDRGDRITDFSVDAVNGDVLEISARGFGGLRVGELLETQFRIGTTKKAADKSDRFIYRTTDDTLWFDRDGTGKKYAPLLVAKFDGDILLSHSDFVLV